MHVCAWHVPFWERKDLECLKEGQESVRMSLLLRPYYNQPRIHCFLVNQICVQNGSLLSVCTTFDRQHDYKSGQFRNNHLFRYYGYLTEETAGLILWYNSSGKLIITLSFLPHRP